jgi:hypothetical protein
VPTWQERSVIKFPYLQPLGIQEEVISHSEKARDHPVLKFVSSNPKNDKNVVPEDAPRALDIPEMGSAGYAGVRMDKYGGNIDDTVGINQRQGDQPTEKKEALIGNEKLGRFRRRLTASNAPECGFWKFSDTGSKKERVLRKQRLAAEILKTMPRMLTCRFLFFFKPAVNRRQNNEG